MSPELAKYYEQRLAMMGDPAWKDLMDDVVAMLDSTDTTNGITDLLQLGIRQGEVRMMNWMLALREISEKAYEELQKDG